METITVSMVPEKETKNKVRYEELGVQDLIGTLYIPKRVLGCTSMSNAPARITVTVEEVEA